MKMAITWTIIILGALLHDMKCEEPASTSPSSTASTVPTNLTEPNLPGSPDSTTLTSLSSTASPVSTKPTTVGSTASPGSNKHTTVGSSASPVSTITASLDSTKLATPSSTASLSSVPPTSQSSITSPDSTQPTSLVPGTSLTTEDSPQQTNANDSLSHIDLTTIQPNTSDALTVPTHSPQNPQTVTPSVSQNTPNSILATTTHKENQNETSAVTTNSAPFSSSQRITPEAQTTSAPKTSDPRPGPHNVPETTTSTPGKIIDRVFDLSSSSEGNVMLETCKTLSQNMKGNCSVSLEIQDNQLVATVRINADQKILTEIYEPPKKQKEKLSEETIPDTLVAILASCGALVLILCCFAAYCTYHRRSYRKNQQHLTEEMQTVENGYHDNPTLEVMEVVPEMQEKKLALNGEFNDSWIVPIDNLLKDDIPDEEDTHL